MLTLKRLCVTDHFSVDACHYRSEYNPGRYSSSGFCMIRLIQMEVDVRFPKKMVLYRKLANSLIGL